MPRKNTNRNFVENGYYHIYNRGVEKRIVFQDDQDYRVFLHLLKYYLSPPKEGVDHPFKDLEDIKRIRPRTIDNLSKEIDLIAHCLMPNHFHLLLKTFTTEGITRFMLRLATTYALYFNKRYKRVGYLFQGPYRSVEAKTDEYVVHLSRYIHQNSLELPRVTRATLVNYPYSSYPYYLQKKRAAWVKPDFILSYFKNPLDYKGFVEGEEDSHQILGDLCIDAD